MQQPTRLPSKPLCIVSKSEPQEQVAKLCSYGLNAVLGEAGTDYVWYPHSQSWGIERKTISNLLQSLGDRQLVEQTHRGSKQFDRYIILLEGEYKRLPSGAFGLYSPRDPRADHSGWVESRWQYAAVAGMLFDLQLIGTNITITHWPVLFDSASAIARIVATTSAESHKFISERQRGDLPDSAALGGQLYSDACWALMALPGVGAEVAQALLAAYGTLYEAIGYLGQDHPSPGATMPADVLVNGRRLGTKKAAKLYEAVTTSFKDSH